MKEFITENMAAFIAIIGVLAGSFGVIIASFKKAKKEIMDVVNKYKEFKGNDGKIDEKEAEELIKELGEAFEASTKLWYLVIGIFKKSKKAK